MRKSLLILVGPKGSGKTYIGTLIEKHFGIPFFRVEDTWVKHHGEFSEHERERKIFKIVEEEIDRELIAQEALIIESTGASEHFAAFLQNLASRYNVKLIQVLAPIDLCNSRVAARDRSKHIPVSDDRVKEINDRAVKVLLPFDLSIENCDSTDETILEKFSSVLKER